MKMKTLSERKKEIELLMRYAVPSSHISKAMNFIEEYAGDVVVLNLLQHFYKNLPGGVDDLGSEGLNSESRPATQICPQMTQIDADPHKNIICVYVRDLREILLTSSAR